MLGGNRQPNLVNASVALAVIGARLIAFTNGRRSYYQSTRLLRFNSEICAGTCANRCRTPQGRVVKRTVLIELPPPAEEKR
jgi:hypothetical protein